MVIELCEWLFRSDGNLKLTLNFDLKDDVESGLISYFYIFFMLYCS